MVEFCRRRYGFSFLEAADYLGALEDGRPTPPPATVPVKYLTVDFAIGCDRYNVSVRDEPRNYASVVRRFYREAGEHMTALGLEQSESTDGETYWTRMALGLDELREIGLP